MARIAVFVTLFVFVISCVFANQKDCAVGPQYWCQSFETAKECGALRHCTDTVWRYDQFEKFTKSCELCQKTLDTIKKSLELIDDQPELVQSALLNGCKTIQQSDSSSKCTEVVKNYGAYVSKLMKYQRYDTLCQLMDICSVQSDAIQTSIEKAIVDEESTMLCHVLVRATHELHSNQKKERNEILTYLENDCKKLSDSKLVQKCQVLVDKYGTDIYGHVASKVDLSKVCSYLGDFADHSSQVISSSVYCDVCQFVVANVDYMLKSKQSEDTVLSYIDDQVCTRLHTDAKKACRSVLLNEGKSVLDGIKSGVKSTLLCTRFHVCLDQVLEKHDVLHKSEAGQFFKQIACDKMGSFSDACHALSEKDSTKLLHALVENVNGNELCSLFGLCPQKSPLLVEENFKDDPAKCTRCVKDFTRRKHIAERLLNHSSEFLHHFCGQLPNENDCVKAIDDSFAELLTFIQSIDPHDICVQLKMCDENSARIVPNLDAEKLIQEEVLLYLKSELCPKLDYLSAWCHHILDSEGLTLLDQIGKSIDPHQVCHILDVCPSNAVMQTCQDKCQCCKNKIDIYQLKLLKFLKSIVASTREMCNYIPARDRCLQLADIFESNVNYAVSRFSSERVCQILSFCPTSQGLLTENDCQTCQNQWNFRQSRFRVVFKQITETFKSLNPESSMDLQTDSFEKKVLATLEATDGQTLCKQLGYCAVDPSFEPSPVQLRLRLLVKQQPTTFDERLTYHDICSPFGLLKPMCEQLLTSPDRRRYALVYESLLHNNPNLIKNDLREQLSTSVNTDVCTACKNTAQSAKDFWINAVDAVRDLLIQACERCPVKDKCQDHYNKLYEAVKAYVNSIDADQFCQSLHFCSSRPLIQQLNGNNNNKGPQCDKCIQRLDERKQVLRQGIERMTNYLSTLCQRFELKQCQVFLQQLQDYSDTTINTWNTQDICTHIGFCSTTDKSVHTDEPSFDQYEKYLKDELETTICTQLGPFQAWCKQILNGNREQVLTVKINDNLRDLMQIGQPINENLLSASNQNQCANDRCQCCVDRINSKKDCLKSMAQQAFGVLIKSCDYCPAKDQCRQYWADNQKQCLASIDTIDAKQICVQIGFCTVSSLCAKMGLFQGACEQVLAKYTQSLKENPELIDQHLPKTSVVVLPTDKDIKPVEDSNATCILCEYLMKILSSYIHSQSTEEEIQKSLDEVCQRMPRTLEKQCTEFVDNYGAAIIATLVQESDLSKLCQKLNICTKQMSVHVEHLTKANVASCGVCDYVSTYVHFALKRDPSDASLQRALDSVCNHLSSEQSSQCQTLVQLFGARIRDLQLSLGKNFCQDLTMCQKPMMELKPAFRIKNQQPEAQKLDDDDNDDDDAANDDEDESKEDMKVINKATEMPQCVLCRYVVSYLNAHLKNNKSEAAVEAALEKVCKVLPKKDRPQCENFAKTYGATLAELLSDLVEPGLICHYMGFCQDLQTEEPSKVTYSDHQYIRIPAEKN